jgi:hypothetical protein
VPRAEQVLFAQHVAMCLWLLLFSAGCSTGASSPLRWREPKVDRARPIVASAEVPIEIVWGLVIVDARVDGLQRPLRLLLDTGAQTVIRSEILETINYAKDESWSTQSVTDASGRPLDLKAVLLKRVSIGAMNLENVPAAGLDAPVFDAFCPPIDGLLGHGGPSSRIGFLDRVVVTIDRDNRVLKLSRGGEQGETGDTVLPIRNYSLTAFGTKEYSSTPQIPILLDGHLHWAALDTGGGGLSEMTVDSFRSLGRTIEDEDVHAFMGVDSIAAGGIPPQAKSWLALIDDVQLGGIDVGSVWFRIVESRKGKRSHIRLNQNLLRLFELVLDHRKNEVRATARESSPASSRLETQMMWGRQNGKIVMVGILERGVAQSAGIRLGDELLAVGNEIVESGNPKSICAVRLEMRRPSDKALKLRLRRGGEFFEVALPREETLSNLP